MIISNDRSGKNNSQEKAEQIEKSENKNLTNRTNNNYLKENYNSWNIWYLFNKDAIGQTEDKIFDCINVDAKREYVHLKSINSRIWTVSMNSESDKTPLVMVHGFCGGVGLWASNLEELSTTRPLYAFDLLGFGRSSRYTFSTEPAIAEKEFIDSIEEWRKEMNIEKMILMGHSFGGYLSSAYSIKYPERVQALILVDPWGFSKRDADKEMRMRDRFAVKMTKFVSLWFILRASGPLSMKFMKKCRPNYQMKYLNIFGKTNLIYEYLYYSNRQRPTGEIAFQTIADKLRYAKHPMDERILALREDIPIWFIYGDMTWVDKSRAKFVQENRPNSFVSAEIINNAGHNLYADQPEHFNSSVKRAFKQIDSHFYDNFDEVEIS